MIHEFDPIIYPRKLWITYDATPDELKESEDELTWLTKYIEEEVYSLSMDIRDNEDRIKLKKLRKSLAWLEKQAERKTHEGMSVSEPYCSDCINKKGCINCVDGDMKETEHKVEPKFKVGDWIVFNGLTLYINEVVQGYYRTISIGGIPNSYDWDIDNVARLWAIQDAKEGDVLINDFHLTFIFKEIKNNMYISHCSIIDRGNDVIVNSMAEREVGDVNLVKCHPATKEQYDLLFSKMKEAGYEWDAEKKETKLLITNGGDFFETENYEQKSIDEILYSHIWNAEAAVDDALKSDNKKYIPDYLAQVSYHLKEAKSMIIKRKH